MNAIEASLNGIPQGSAEARSPISLATRVTSNGHVQMVTLLEAIGLGQSLQANTDALGSVTAALGALKASVDAGNEIAQRNLDLASAMANPSDAGYAKNFSAAGTQWIFKAGTKGAQLTSIAAACASALGVVGAGAGTATFFYADAQTATSGTIVAVLPFAGNGASSAFLKAAVPAGKYLLVSSNVGGVTATCTVRQL